MAARSEKTKKTIENNVPEKNATKKVIPSKSKAESADEDDELEIESVKVVKPGKKAGSIKARSEDEEEIVEEIEEEETWKKEDEDEDWDPDFAEFDLPKSSSKKGITIKKSVKDDDDDFKVDDEFKDLFNQSSSKYNHDDDDY